MIKLHLADNKIITCASRASLFHTATCERVHCNECPFGRHCASDISERTTFGEAMNEYEAQINKLVVLVEECDEPEPNKQTFTFELTKEQAIYLSAFMNVFNEDDIPYVLDVLNFYDKPDYPFITLDIDKGNVPKEWHEGDRHHVEKVMLDISYEIFNKLVKQREFD